MNQSLSWSEPRWSYVPELKRELACVLRLGMWLRVSVVCGLLTFLLARAVQRVASELEFDWVGSLLKAIGMMVAGLGAFAGILFLFPPLVTVGPKGMARQQGQGTRWWLRGDIRAMTVDWTEPTKPLLRVEAAKPITVGVGPKIARAQLTGFLRETFPEVLVEEKQPSPARTLP
jgi:hypothetical protein